MYEAEKLGKSEFLSSPSKVLRRVDIVWTLTLYCFYTAT